MAVGESVMQQVLGLGIAARVSAKLGEGVLNGLMTARFGLAALNVCRPLPFVREARRGSPTSPASCCALGRGRAEIVAGYLAPAAARRLAMRENMLPV